MKTKIIFGIISMMFIVSCTKNQPQETSANFTTSLDNNTVIVGDGFTVYLQDAKGEFLTYFKGANESNTFSVSNPPPEGEVIEGTPDSIEISSYRFAGQYTFTLVARSFGDFGNELEMDVDSVVITVVEP